MSFCSLLSGRWAWKQGLALTVDVLGLVGDTSYHRLRKEWLGSWVVSVQPITTAVGTEGWSQDKNEIKMFPSNKD